MNGYTKTGQLILARRRNPGVTGDWGSPPCYACQKPVYILPITFYGKYTYFEGFLCEEHLKVFWAVYEPKIPFQGELLK